jgi:hypothetical protein
MPFDAADPRATLTTTASSNAPAPTEFAAPQFLPFTDELARTSPLGSRTWVVRIQNAAVAYTNAVQGDTLPAIGDASERIVATTSLTSELRIENGADTVTLTGPGLAIVAPGPTSIFCENPSEVVQIFSSAARDVLALAMNATAYADVPPNVLVHEPERSIETAVRVYLLADFPADGRRFGTIFRSTNLMFNIIDELRGPRNPAKLSPHTHDDFEQCSLQLGGTFRHHVRTPWTPDMPNWRDDDHVEMDGPGAVIFPPPLVHTSQAIGVGVNRLADVFAPPRADFLAKAGWVLNAEDYSNAEVLAR